MCRCQSTSTIQQVAMCWFMPFIKTISKWNKWSFLNAAIVIISVIAINLIHQLGNKWSLSSTWNRCISPIFQPHLQSIPKYESKFEKNQSTSSGKSISNLHFHPEPYQCKALSRLLFWEQMSWTKVDLAYNCQMRPWLPFFVYHSERYDWSRIAWKLPNRRCLMNPSAR